MKRSVFPLGTYPGYVWGKNVSGINNIPGKTHEMSCKKNLQEAEIYGKAPENHYGN